MSPSVPATILLALLAMAAAPAALADPVPQALPLTVTVDGEQAHGLWARPHGKPHALVVIAHGYTHSSESHRTHLEQLASRGAVAVAMDYRGPQDGFPLAAGAADTVAATQKLLARQEYDLVVLFSVSMGAAVAGMVLAQMPGVFDYWVAPEPMANLAETWAEATAVAPFVPLGARVAAQLEDETGGTPATATEAYLQRMAVARVPEIQGLSGAFVFHGLNDGLVPYNQGRELSEALRAHGLPTDFTTVGRGQPGGEGTTLTGYGGLQLDGLAGHGTESNDTHTLTRLSWDVTYRLVEGEADVLPANREFVVDRELP